MDNDNVNLPIQFCLGIKSGKLDTVESREVSFKQEMCIIFINAIDESYILNTRKYLMVKNNSK